MAANLIRVMLAGNPNTGKSVFFNRLTGIGVISSNYPGTTVEVLRGKTKVDGVEIEVLDLPGTYSLGSETEDQQVATRAMLEEDGVIVDIVDASRLKRNLYLTLQLIEMGKPLVIALNMMDEARKRGMVIDVAKLSSMLGVPVVPAIAVRGKGVREALEAAIRVWEDRRSPMRIEYSPRAEKLIKPIEAALEQRREALSLKASPRGVAIKLIEGDPLIVKAISERTPDIVELAKKIQAEASRLGASLTVWIAEERYRIIDRILKEAVVEEAHAELPLGEKLDAIVLSPIAGPIALSMVLASMILALIYAGGFIEELMVSAWQLLASPILSWSRNTLSPPAAAAIEGFSLGVEAALAVAVPYILVFYVLLAILEDVGYLPRIAYLTDNLMHKLGLHGRAIIPLVLGYGCNVPSILATRTLETRRERVIASFLSTMIPCSARTAVIVGFLGSYYGIKAALAVYLIDLAVVYTSGLLLNRLLKGERAGLVMELPPYRVPSPLPVISKTWLRFKSFMDTALPLLVAGSIALSLLSYYGLTDPLSAAISPFIAGLLKLPKETAIPLLFGVLRKEMTLEMLVVAFRTSDLSAVMSFQQAMVFTAVTTLYVPCIATVAVLIREIGVKEAAIAILLNILIATLIGTLLAIGLNI